MGLPEEENITVILFLRNIKVFFYFVFNRDCLSAPDEVIGLIHIWSLVCFNYFYIGILFDHDFKLAGFIGEVFNNLNWIQT